MLNLTQEVVDYVGEPARRSFEHRMSRHLREFFPTRCAPVDDQKLREFIRGAIDKARVYGIVRERDVARFIDLMVALHPNFDTDPQMPWAKPILLNMERTAMARLEAIYCTLLERSGVRSFTGGQP